MYKRIALLGAVGFFVLGSAPAMASYTAKLDGTTVEVTGNGDADTLTLGVDTTTLFLDVGSDGTTDFAFDKSLFTNIDVSAGGGDDRVNVVGNLADKALTVDGGGGNDFLLGSNGADVLRGGSGNDFIDGNIGADTESGGSGNDTFQWDPGDNSDVLDGNDGKDTLAFNGSNIGEQIELSAIGDRASLFRNVASVTQDLGTIEQVNIRALGGADTIKVGDLTGTGVGTVTTDLNGFDGNPDLAADTVNVLGTADADYADASSPVAGDVLIKGLDGTNVVTHGGEALDAIAVSLLGGADTFTTSTALTAAPVVRVDGGDDADVARYSGTGGDDSIGLAADASSVRTFSTAGGSGMATANVEDLDVIGGGGNDTIAGQNGIATFTHLTEEGGSGNDSLRGGDGDDTLLGGSGNDVLDGNRGADSELGSTGNDTFQWDPGDGSDELDGEAGSDVMAFTGSNIGEKLDVEPNETRVRLTRDVAAVTQDLTSIERANLRLLGGADTVTIGDLAGTGLTTVASDLSGFDGNGDEAADTVIANGGEGAETVKASSPVAGEAMLTGLPANVIVDGGETTDSLVASLGAGDDTFLATTALNAATVVRADGGADTDTARYSGTAGDDTIGIAADAGSVRTFSSAGGSGIASTVENLDVTGGDGNDTVAGQNGIATFTHLTEDGGSGDDTLRGGDGDDTLLGRDGNDLVDGNRGNDTALLGSGDDHFQWDPGDGSDDVKGASGTDTLNFNGSNAGEKIAVARDSSRIRLTRDIAAINLEFDGIEDLAVRLLGSADSLTIDDTPLKTAEIDLGGFDGNPDLAADSVVLNGTDGAESVAVTRSGSAVQVGGLRTAYTLTGSEPADTLGINTLGGDDDVTVAPDVPALITPLVDLGAGN
jgi:Ca2+-binding RTX toxin-like protein